VPIGPAKLSLGEPGGRGRPAAGIHYAAFGLATRIALLAEAQGHHPELEVGWGRLVVRLTTHSVGGLSRNDIIMAARIDRLTGG
jgi:pterin-4a-carbinolamine dehydratase